MAEWIKALVVAALPAPGMRRVSLEGTAVLLVNTGDQIRAFGARLPACGRAARTGCALRGAHRMPMAQGGLFDRDRPAARTARARRADVVPRLRGGRDRVCRTGAPARGDGGSLRAKAVIVGIGVRPATRFPSGVDVDAAMRVTRDAYAAGDIARFVSGGVPSGGVPSGGVPSGGVPSGGAPLPGTMHGPQRMRIEHWRVAQQQARVAALNMLGGNVRYEGVPFFWTQHYDKRIDYLGHATHWDDLVISGRPGDARFGILYSRLGRLQAALACGYEREMALMSERMREPLPTGSARDILGF